MMRQLLPLCLLALPFPATAADARQPMNLLLNPDFHFHCFDNSRTGQAPSYKAGAIPGWNMDAYGDAEVWRATRLPRNIGLPFPAPNVVVIHPGKRLVQFSLLSELGLDHGDTVHFHVWGCQEEPGALESRIHLMRLDSAAGDWKPDFDQRMFPKHSRGELVRGPSQAVRSDAANPFRLNAQLTIVGAFTEDPDRSTDQPNTIGIEVELVNRSVDKDVIVAAPWLTPAPAPADTTRLAEARPLPQYYRGIPRTIHKLWRGEPLHIIVMGSSIDRGSANPPLTLYDEDPESPTYKQPLSGRDFDGQLIGHPEWNDYIAWWQHYFMYGGRLRRALMEKFNYPIDRILLNTMACDGSSISEAHSGLAAYAALTLPPDPGVNGHRAGKSWRELYPAVFARPEGPRPDLVIFGSGANEKVDGAAELALFEGAVRWFQRHYPGIEFLFCMWQNRESYTPNTGHLMELALGYQIPYIDLARTLSLTTRHCNSYALCPRDGHPQAAGHYLWFKQLERAFDAADPIQSGRAQLHLPPRLHAATVGWEGEIETYASDSPRIRGGQGIVLDDAAVNLWAACKEGPVGVRIDGQDSAGSRRRPSGARDLRNSTFATGLLSLGDRHVVEVAGDARLVAVDCKLVPGRQWTGVDSPRWQLGGLQPGEFSSSWGAPYGKWQVEIPAGQAVEVELPGTVLSVAYVDRDAGGTLLAEVDGQESLRVATNQPFLAGGEPLFMENRRGILNLPYGLHRLRAAAVDGPVSLLGAFSYDTRANRANERVVRGTAFPGEVLRFSPPFAARPLVLTSGGLQVASDALGRAEVRFSGTGPGGYEIAGE